MIRRSYIEGILCAQFKTTSSITFIQTLPQSDSDYANPPRPEKPYGHVRLLTMENAGGLDEKKYVALDSDNLTERSDGFRRVGMSINAYGPNSYEVLYDICNRLTTNEYTEFFNSNNIGYHTHSDIRDLSVEDDEGLEERFQFDLFLYAPDYVENVVPCINAVDIYGIIDDKTKQVSIISEVTSQ